ncbi:MAG: ATP-binding cassette domain-containing protein [bacterium]|nr:ATP-binding cassette domain-containing protein [bacterium]
MRPERGDLSYSGDAQPALLLQNPRQQLICSSAHEEIVYSLQLQGCPAESLESRASELLRSFNFEGISGAAPDSLSGGQQQRLALAALLTRDPQLLLLDEPESYLDGRSRTEFRAFFARTIRSCAVIWTCCRRSEVPEGVKAYRLESHGIVELGDAGE